MFPKASLALVLVASLIAGSAASRRNSTAVHAKIASKGSSEATAAVAAINAVEQALAKLTSNPRMSPEMVGAAKKVTQEAEQAAKEIESVNTSKAEKMKLVGHAITSLQSLQGTWEKAAKDALANEKAAEDKETSAAARIAVLKEKLEQKKAMLAKDETMLKEAQVQKQLLERAEQAEGGSREEARQQERIRRCQRPWSTSWPTCDPAPRTSPRPWSAWTLRRRIARPSWRRSGGRRALPGQRTPSSRARRCSPC
ncbi:unnamed protein product [Prorocentrum cordatum]|uniref:Uncharacterized protein n=1 Tax=Prorocentrum cordatum TaxID=2364126 RepID=A0ABN9R0E4_9DINO|nr:unnamed protein product [Polarella glacialis]